MLNLERRVYEFGTKMRWAGTHVPPTCWAGTMTHSPPVFCCVGAGCWPIPGDEIRIGRSVRLAGIYRPVCRLLGGRRGPRRLVHRPDKERSGQYGAANDGRWYPIIAAASVAASTVIVFARLRRSTGRPRDKQTQKHEKLLLLFS